jgi:hypothetical protein
MSSIGKYTPTKKPKVKKVEKDLGGYWHYTAKGKKVRRSRGPKVPGIKYD